MTLAKFMAVRLYSYMMLYEFIKIPISSVTVPINRATNVPKFFSIVVSMLEILRDYEILYAHIKSLLLIGEVIKSVFTSLMDKL